ncbi:SMC-Scp complex subunit ScpB [Candidatus Oleimmundimicrobium sp.]|uniref:SMC-Scp complex subunit ScpB n=1 Tax=Candidatus Oleimmundimicrobium sp. TaxID=3060597 RepID=UPI00271B0D41|nr:SMC-Scp complex subunit ScpB [Candidatus Oleimmundimicrobium sp.]MDO8886103.1 SMC-Scp complex subunit ScpB [Candidatus Oleimmundimicrobium sp.]
MESNIKGVLEALLFVADEPLTLKKLIKITGFDGELIEKNLKKLVDEYQQGNRGIQLREVAEGYRFFTHPAYAPFIEELVLSADYRKLSQASLETLAIIAYRQPVTRSQIGAIRGVNSMGAIASLQEKGLIKEVGREHGPGQPILYGTTKIFLENFGLKNIKELPPLKDFAPDDETIEQLQLTLMADRVEKIEKES